MGENENLNDDAKRKCMVMELEKGKETLIRLRKLMMDPVQDLDNVSLFDELALQISASFNVTLSMLTTCPHLSESTQIDGSICSGDSTKKKKTTTVNDRRGCYKRRKTSDSWETVSPAQEDGHAWRKYGQKGIQNSQYPRCYYRCTYKSQGCKAQKQVQKHKEDPSLFHTTYFHHHTCNKDHTTTTMDPLLISDPDPIDPNILISFQQQVVGTKLSSTPMMKLEESLTGDASKYSSQNMDTWMDHIVGSDFWLEHKPLWGPTIQEVGSSLQSCGSTSFNGFDKEVNQLDDDIEYDQI